MPCEEPGLQRASRNPLHTNSSVDTCIFESRTTGWDCTDKSQILELVAKTFA
jgi:hypothetical protein